MAYRSSRSSTLTKEEIHPHHWRRIAQVVEHGTVERMEIWKSQGRGFESLSADFLDSFFDAYVSMRKHTYCFFPPVFRKNV